MGEERKKQKNGILPVLSRAERVQLQNLNPTTLTGHAPNAVKRFFE